MFFRKIFTKSDVITKAAKPVVSRASAVANHARPVHATELRVLDSSWATNLSIGTSHSLISDIRHEHNGAIVDLGASPKELLMSSLASSAVMSVRAGYEKELKFEEELIKSGRMSSFIDAGARYEGDVYVQGDQHWRHSCLEGVSCDVVEVLNTMDIDTPKEIQMKFKFDGTLTAEQKNTLLRAADDCPIRHVLCGEGIAGDRTARMVITSAFTNK